MTVALTDCAKPCSHFEKLRKFSRAFCCCPRKYTSGFAQRETIACAEERSECIRTQHLVVPPITGLSCKQLKPLISRGLRKQTRLRQAARRYFSVQKGSTHIVWDGLKSITLSKSSACPLVLYRPFEPQNKPRSIKAASSYLQLVSW